MPTVLEITFFEARWSLLQTLATVGKMLWRHSRHNNVTCGNRTAIALHRMYSCSSKFLTLPARYHPAKYIYLFLWSCASRPGYLWSNHATCLLLQATSSIPHKLSIITIFLPRTREQGGAADGKVAAAVRSICRLDAAGGNTTAT